jgi:hypothetical protein
MGMIRVEGRWRVLVAAAAVLVLLALWLARGRGRGRPSLGQGATAARVTGDGAGSKRRTGGAGDRAVRSPDDRGGPLRLDGQVIDEAGAPVGEALVVLSTEPPRRTRSEQDGSFSFEGLVPRDLSIHALAGDRVGMLLHRLGSESDPAIVRVHLGTKVQVQVRDAAGVPIAGAEVRPAGPLFVDAAVFTDAAGEALLRGLDGRSSSTIRVSAAGYTPSMTLLLPDVSGRVVPTVEVVLRRGVAVSGKVRDEAGRPIAGAKINCASMRDADNTTSDDDGNFRFAAISPGSYHVAAEEPLHVGGPPKMIEVAALDVTGVELTLATGGVLVGVVVQRDGKPAPYAVVKAAAAGLSGVTSPRRWAAADAEGHFALGGLPRQELQLRAASEQASSELVDVSLVDAPRRDQLRLVLDVVGAIRGVVVDERGEPAPEVQVRAMPRRRPQSPGAHYLMGMVFATTNGSGAFAIHGLADEEYSLTLGDASPFADNLESEVVRPGATDVKLVMRRAGAVVGRLVDAAGTPLPGPVYLAFDDRGTAISSTGAFRFADVAPGKHRLELRSRGFSKRTFAQLQLASGQTLDLGDIVMGAGGRVIGHVVDLKGRPVAGAKVRASPTNVFVDSDGDALGGESPGALMQGILTATSDARGAFELRGLSAEEPTSVVALSPAGCSAAVQLAAGATSTPVTLVLHGYGSLEGVVTKQGKPMTGIDVQVISNDMRVFRTVLTGSDGSFQLSRIPEGQVDVTARHDTDTSVTPSTLVTVEAGKRARVTLAMAGGDLSLSVAMKAPPGLPDDAAAVALFDGAVTVTNAQELSERAFKSKTPRLAHWMPGMPVTFHDLEAGTYALCAALLTRTSEQRGGGMRTSYQPAKGPATCQAVTVTAAPAEQRVTFKLPTPTTPATTDQAPR